MTSNQQGDEDGDDGDNDEKVGEKTLFPEQAAEETKRE